MDFSGERGIISLESHFHFEEETCRDSRRSFTLGVLVGVVLAGEGHKPLTFAVAAVFRDVLATNGRPTSMTAPRPSPHPTIEGKRVSSLNASVSDTARAGNQEFAAMRGGTGVLI